MFEFKNKEELTRFIAENVIGTGEATVIMNCSRQYIDQLTRAGKIVAIKTLPKNKLFWKSDIVEEARKRNE